MQRLRLVGVPTTCAQISPILHCFQPVNPKNRQPDNGMLQNWRFPSAVNPTRQLDTLCLFRGSPVLYPRESADPGRCRDRFKSSPFESAPRPGHLARDTLALRAILTGIPRLARLSPTMLEQVFKRNDDILRKGAGVSSELDYIEQTSWLPLRIRAVRQGIRFAGAKS